MKNYNSNLEFDWVLLRELDIACDLVSDSALVLQSGDYQVSCPHCTAAFNVKHISASQPINCVLCGFRIPKEATDMRSKERYSLNEAIRFVAVEDNVMQQGRVINMSDVGMKGVSFGMVRNGQSVSIFSDRFNAAGKVVWVRELAGYFRPVYEFGIVFSELKFLEEKIIFESVA